MNCKRLPLALLSALAACATTAVSQTNPFLDQQALRPDEPYALVVFPVNPESLVIVAIDGLSTRFDQVEHWTNQYYPVQTKVRPGPHTLRFGVHGEETAAFDTTIDMKAGQRYEFTVWHSPQGNSYKPVLASPPS